MPFKSSNARSVGKFLPVYSNEDLSLLEDKNFTRRNVFNATGGTRVASGIEPGNGFRYHVWTSPGTLTVQNSPGMNVEFLVVGGGGTGGDSGPGPAAPGHGGNGGAGGGGIKVGTALPLQSGTYTITVGQGGPSSPTGSTNPYRSGTPSSITHPAISDVIGLGGGGGGRDDDDTRGSGPTVGSGGGSWGGGGAPQPGATGQPSQPTTYTSTNYGYNGGGGANGSAWAGGGGGGAGSVGDTNPNNSNAGNGGNGQPFPAYSSAILQAGVPTGAWSSFSTALGPTSLYAGGGAGTRGGPNWGGNDGAGGPGGGGNVGTPGATNTGGGAGGYSPNGPPTAGVGAAGIVVIRYPI